MFNQTYIPRTGLTTAPHAQSNPLKEQSSRSHIRSNRSVIGELRKHQKCGSVQLLVILVGGTSIVGVGNGICAFEVLLALGLIDRTEERNVDSRSVEVVHSSMVNVERAARRQGCRIRWSLARLSSHARASWPASEALPEFGRGVASQRLCRSSCWSQTPLSLSRDHVPCTRVS